MAIEYPLVNGERHDFAAIEITIETEAGPKRFKGFASVNYSIGLEPGQVRGTAARKLGRTLGEATEEGSLEMYMAEWDELRAALGSGYMRKSFNVTITYGADGLPVTTDTLEGCRIKKVDKNHSQGTDGLKVKLDLDIMKILEGGLDPIGAQP
jgi:hypothetical protein